jgi:hypothetical protein
MLIWKAISLQPVETPPARADISQALAPLSDLILHKS